MDPLTVSVVLGAVAGGLVQGLSGTAFGLTAMAVWAWTLDPVLTGPWSSSARSWARCCP